MVTADWVLLALSLISILIGWQSGAIRVIAGVGSWFIGWQVARTFATCLSGWLYSLLGQAASATAEGSAWNSLYLFLDSTSALEKIFYVIAFIIIFVLVVVIIKKIAAALRSAIRPHVVGTLDSAVGAFLALFVFAIIINLILTFLLPLIGDGGALGQLKDFLSSSQKILPLLLAMTGYFLTGTNELFQFFGMPKSSGEPAATASLVDLWKTWRV